MADGGWWVWQADKALWVSNHNMRAQAPGGGQVLEVLRIRGNIQGRRLLHRFNNSSINARCSRKGNSYISNKFNIRCKDRGHSFRNSEESLGKR
jgi:hypothetical protein